MIVRIAFGTLLVLSTCLVYAPQVDRLLSRKNALAVLQALFVSSRFLGWLASYALVPDLVRHSDLILYYYPEAQKILQGQLPYRDFPTSYGLPFAYLTGGMLLLWDAVASIALLMISFEIAAVLIFSEFVRRHGDAADQRALGRTMFVYLLNPAALYWSGMMAYNSSIVLLFWIIGVLLLWRGLYTWSLLAVTASAAAKVLGLLAVPVWIMHPHRRYLSMVAVAITAALLWFTLRHSGIDLLIPLQREGNRSTSGNVWFLSTLYIPFSRDAALWRFGPALLLLASVGAFAAVLQSRWRSAPSLPQLVGALSAICWLFMIVSKKTLPHYLPMFVLLTVFAASRGLPSKGSWPILLALLGMAGLLEPGLWNGLRQPIVLRTVCSAGCGTGAILLITADVFLIVLSGYFCAISARVALASGSR